MIVIKRNKQGNLKATYQQRSYSIYLDKKRYYFNVNKVPIYCTKEVNKFIKKGGGNIIFSELPPEAQDNILCSLTKEDIDDLSLSNKANHAVVVAFWNKILLEPFLVFFTTLRSKILRNEQLIHDIIRKLELVKGRYYNVLLAQAQNEEQEALQDEANQEIREIDLKIFSLRHPELHTVIDIREAFNLTQL